MWVPGGLGPQLELPIPLVVVHLQQVRQGLLLHAPAVPLDLSGSGGNGVDAGLEILLGDHAGHLLQAGPSAQAQGPSPMRMCYR